MKLSDHHQPHSELCQHPTDVAHDVFSIKDMRIFMEMDSKRAYMELDRYLGDNVGSLRMYTRLDLVAEGSFQAIMEMHETF